MKRTILQINCNGAFSGLFLLLAAIAVSDFRLIGVYILFAICGLFLILNYSKIWVPAQCFPVLAAAGLYFLSCFGYQGMVVAAKMLVCPLLWLVGYNMTEAKNIRTVFRVLTVLALGMAFHGLLNYAYNVAMGVVFSTGKTYDIWSGSYAAATGQVANFTLFLAMLPWLLLTQKSKLLKLVAMAVFVVSAMYAIQVGSRTFLVISGLLLLTCLIYYVVHGKQRGKVVKLTLVALIVGVLVAVIYLTDTMGLRTILEGSYLFRRVTRDGESFADIFTGGRFALKRTYLKNLFRYPWGGNQAFVAAGNFAHDLWLDVYNDAGVVPMFALLIYSVAALIRHNRVRKSGGLNENERLALLGYMAVIHAQFLVEPIWQGAPLLFCVYVLGDGMLAKYLVCARRGYMSHDSLKGKRAE